MADTQTPPPRKGPPWGRIALVTSLALNLLVAGLIAGAFLGDGPRDRDPDRRPSLRDLGYGPYIDALPRTDRSEMGRALVREAGAFRQNREQIRTQFEEFLTALRADPYDAETVRRLIDAQQGNLSERRALGRRLLLERIEAMDDAGRAAYADRLDKLLKRGPRPPRPPRDN